MRLKMVRELTGSPGFIDHPYTCSITRENFTRIPQNIIRCERIIFLFVYPNNRSKGVFTIKIIVYEFNEITHLHGITTKLRASPNQVSTLPSEVRIRYLLGNFTPTSSRTIPVRWLCFTVVNRTISPIFTKSPSTHHPHGYPG